MPQGDANGSGSPRWRRRSTLVLAMAGGAAGLGGLVLLPAQSARHGGAAFMAAYFALLLLLGLPLLWVEWTLGRRGGTLGYSSLPGMLQSLSRARGVRYAGALGVALPLVLAIVVVSLQAWAAGHAFDAFTGALPAGGADRHLQAFLGTDGGFLGQPGWRGSPALYAFFALTLAADLWLLLRGPLAGLAAAASVALPVALLAALLLAASAAWLPETAGRQPSEGLLQGWAPGWQALFSADADALWSAAAGLVILTLGLGIGAVPTLAAPLREGDDIPLTSLASASIGQLLAVVFGGLLLLPAAFVVLGPEGLQRSAGDVTTLAFVAVPAAFGGATVPGLGGAAGAAVLGGLWFTLLFALLLLSALALCLPAVTFLRDAMGLSHRRAVAVVGLLVAVGSQPALLLSGVLRELTYWVRWPGLPLLALLEVLLLVLAFGSRRGWDHLHRGAALRIPRSYRFVLTFLTPLLLLATLARWAWREAGPVLRQQVGPDGQPYPGGTERNALLARGMILAVLALFTAFVAVASRRGHFRPFDPSR